MVVKVHHQCRLLHSARVDAVASTLATARVSACCRTNAWGGALGGATDTGGMTAEGAAFARTSGNGKPSEMIRRSTENLKRNIRLNRRRAHEQPALRRPGQS